MQARLSAVHTSCRTQRGPRLRRRLVRTAEECLMRIFQCISGGKIPRRLPVLNLIGAWGVRQILSARLASALRGLARWTAGYRDSAPAS